MKNFHNFPKNTPSGYPDLKKTGPLRHLAKKGARQVSAEMLSMMSEGSETVSYHLATFCAKKIIRVEISTNKIS